MPTPLHILHVDDEPMVLDMVRAALVGEMTVDRATSLAQAREQLAVQSYDLLLVDLRLGDSDGVGTVTALRPYNIPIVVLSVLDKPEVLAAAAEAGAEDYILKAGATPLRLLNRLRFAHARYQKRMAYEQGEAKRRAGQRKRYLETAAFEALKPFISCANVGVGSRSPFVAAR
jgi:DNA-binding response OmpR family regulator